MNKIKVHTQNRTYDIMIGQQLLERAGELIEKSFRPEKTLIVTDTTVASLYLSTLETALNRQGFANKSCILSPGEEHKNLNSLMFIISKLSEWDMSRTDMVIALGGGTVSDTAALAASLFLRGIRLVLIPTTLLSAVDAAIGGKTAINLESGKNQMGSFYQPHMVLISSNCLLSLNKYELENGIAEIIKYSFLNAPYIIPLLHESIRPTNPNEESEPEQKNKLLQKINSKPLEGLIAACVKIKVNIIEKDEKDLGLRQLLNFGHTIGHGIEKCSEYKISHGRAVAIGMALITKASVAENLCSSDRSEALIKELSLYSLPFSTDLTMKELFPFIMKDKKRTSDFFSLVCPVNEDKVEIIRVKTEKVYDFLNKGFQE